MIEGNEGKFNIVNKARSSKTGYSRPGKSVLIVSVIQAENEGGDCSPLSGRKGFSSGVFLCHHSGFSNRHQ